MHVIRLSLLPQNPGPAEERGECGCFSIVFPWELDGERVKVGLDPWESPSGIQLQVFQALLELASLPVMHGSIWGEEE